MGRRLPVLMPAGAKRNRLGEPGFASFTRRFFQMQAILALEDGSTFSGQGFGAPGVRVGQVVFNTAMTGYQELLTDPSSTGQIVLLTAAHVGNTGVNAEDNESEGMHAAGLVLGDYLGRHSS